MIKIAPFADKPIELSLSSITGLKYRTFNCIECGQPFVERSSERIFRIGSDDMPEEVHLDAGRFKATCGRCAQQYVLSLAEVVDNYMGQTPLYMHPQTIFITSEPNKKFRDTYCLECGKAFYSISDRVKLLVDNVVPQDMLDPNKLGPMEVWCKFHHCKQRWSVMT